jgi:hypothetical protein
VPLHTLPELYEFAIQLALFFSLSPQGSRWHPSKNIRYLSRLTQLSTPVSHTAQLLLN